jgi:hypothetical protein
MPRELSGGFCFHCGRVYQRNDPEFWLGEEFPNSEAAHLKNCASYQEHCKKAEEGWAKFRAMTPEGTDTETFSKLLRACYSKVRASPAQKLVVVPEPSVGHFGGLPHRLFTLELRNETTECTCVDP